MPARAAAKKRSVKCAGPSCSVRFTPQRSTAKYHAAACREAARRARVAQADSKPKAAKKAAAKKTATSSKSTGTKKVASAADSHDLVLALRRELEAAAALDTFEGQLALELAKRLVQADSAASSLAGQVRTARAAALALAGATPPAPGAGPTDEDDEVTRARKQREEARQAAGLS